MTRRGERRRPVRWFRRLDTLETSRDDDVGVGAPGEGFWSCSATKRMTAACNSRAERNTPCFRRRGVSFAKTASTAFSRKPEVGEKRKVRRGVAVEPCADVGALVRGTGVEDQAHFIPGGGRRARMRSRQVDELPSTAAPHVAAEDLVGADVRLGEARGRAVAPAVARQGRASVLLERQPRLGAVERLESGASRPRRAQRRGRGGATQIPATACRFSAKAGASERLKRRRRNGGAAPGRARRRNRGRGGTGPWAGPQSRPRAPRSARRPASSVVAGASRLRTTCPRSWP